MLSNYYRFSHKISIFIEDVPTQGIPASGRLVCRISQREGIKRLYLILCLLSTFFPHTESTQSLITHQGNHRLMAVCYLAVDLLIDKLIIETNLRCILTIVGS